MSFVVVVAEKEYQQDTCDRVIDVAQKEQSRRVWY
jgi:hypothetical protein